MLNSLRAEGRRADFLALAALAAVAVFVRLLVLALVELQEAQQGDSIYYLAVAKSIWSSGVHALGTDLPPTSLRVPLYSFLLSWLLVPHGQTGWLILFQAALTFAAGVIVFFALRRENRSIAFLSALLIVANPFNPFYEVRVLSEILYAALVISSLILLYRAGNGSWAMTVVGGILLGLAILTRETILLLPIFVAASFVFFPNKLEKLKHLVVAALLAYLIVAPWAYRNSTLPGGSFELSRGLLGQNLWVGTWERNPDWVMEGIPDYAFRSPQEREVVTRAMAKLDDPVLKKLAVDRIKSDPLGTFKVWVMRHHRLWLGTRSEHVTLRAEAGSLPWKLIKGALYGLNALLLLLTLVGAAIAARRKPSLLFFFVPIAYTAAIYFPFHNTEPRYSLFALNIGFVFVALALCSGWAAVQRRRKGRGSVSEAERA
jgi:4-amino-4-deoxy-L-arabinose transferase-like glycosyltransferase